MTEQLENLQLIKQQISELLQEFRTIANDLENPNPGWDAYVFEQIEKHIDDQEDYNQSLESIINEIQDK